MKKIFIPFLTAGILFGGAQLPNAQASDELNDLSSAAVSTPYVGPVESTINELVQPRANIVYVNGTIAQSGTITNYKMGQMIAYKKKDKTWLDILNTLALYKIGPAGLGNALASSLAGDGLDKIQTQYDKGNNMYWVATYAAGPNTLSKIYYRSYGTVPITYIQE